MISIGLNIIWINLRISALVHLNGSSIDVGSVVMLDEFENSPNPVIEKLKLTSVSIFYK